MELYTDMPPKVTRKREPESDLLRSPELYRLLVDAVEDYAIFSLDSQGHILTWNQGAARLKGYSADEIIGHHFSRFYTPTDINRNHPENELKLARETGKYEEEGWRVKKDGSLFWASVTITALRDSQGVLRGFGKVTRDLTKKRMAEMALRESEEKFRLMVESVEDYAVFMLTPNGNIATWNKGAERNKGYSADDIIGQHFSVFYPELDVKAGKPAFELQEAERVGKFEDEGWRVRKDGSRFWANVVITAMRDKSGRLIGFSKVTRNLTERKEAEDRLRAAYADLEDRIQLRTKELSEAKRKAEAAVKMRDEFFSIASHELKTPISALKLQAQLRKRNVARGNFSDFAPENLIELCEEDELQLDRLVFLVENMLDVSRLTSDNFSLVFDTFDAGKFIADCANRMRIFLRESDTHCEIESSTSAQVVWDRHRMEQVLINLLSNAGKYASGKPVRITVSSDEREARISVRDQGKGISAADQSVIFKPFERIKGSPAVGGLGLGLYITKQIVEAHRGRIEVESELGKGSTFHITLPLDASAAEKA